MSDVTTYNPATGITDLIVAGWTGRDRDAMEHHIAELEALGVARPKETPTFYRVSPQLLTRDAAIQVTGDKTSGEVEIVLFHTAGGMRIGLGSDHTDRQLETVGVTVSKQVCAKPVGPDSWLWSEVADHWDDLILRSWTVTAGKREIYQDGTAAAMRHPDDLISLYTKGARTVLSEGEAMFCGTLAAIGGIRYAPRLELELEDPVLGRVLRTGYDIRPLPVHG